MLKKFLFAIVTLFMSISLAFAQVEVNKADQAGLDGVKGIGPKISKTIIDERTKNGEFKDWADFQKRVKGIGDKNSVKLSQAGLTVNGKPKDGAAPVAADAKADAKTDAKAATKSDKPASTTPAASTKK